MSPSLSYNYHSSYNYILQIMKMYLKDKNVLPALGNYAFEPDKYQAVGDIVFVSIVFLAVTPKN